MGEVPRAVKVLIVEDNPLDIGEALDSLARLVPGVKVAKFPTEEGFRQSIDKIKRTPPDVAVIDLALKYRALREETLGLPVPEEVRTDGFRGAGLRCLRLLLSSPETARIPVMLWSYLHFFNPEGGSEANNPGNVFFLSKDAGFDDMAREVFSLARLQRPIRSSLASLPPAR